MNRSDRTSVWLLPLAGLVATVAGLLPFGTGAAHADPFGRRGLIAGPAATPLGLGTKRPLMRQGMPGYDMIVRKPVIADMPLRVRPSRQTLDRVPTLADRPKPSAPSRPTVTIRDIPKLPRITTPVVTPVPSRLGDVTRPGNTKHKPDRPPGNTTPDGKPPQTDRPPGGVAGDRPPRPPRDRQPPVIVLPDMPRLPPVVTPLPPAGTAPPVVALPPRPPSVSRPPVRVLPLPPLAQPPTSPPQQALPPPQPPQPSQPGGAPPALADLPSFAPDEVLVTLPDATPETLEAAVAQQFNLTIVERTTLALLSVRVIRLRIPDQRSVPAVIAALQADTRVPAAQPNFFYRFLRDLGQPQPAAAVGTAGLQYTFARIALSQAQPLASGVGATIAVIDSGIDRRHTDFATAAIEEFDVTGAPAALDPHGTAVAGIIAARGTVRGVAPGARVLSARAFSAASPGQRGGPTAATAGLAKALDWAIGQGASVVNMSFAGPRDPLFERMVAALHARRIIAVAAAGNGGPSAAPAYPAAYPGVVAVTATDADDRLYAQANRGAYIALAAPGVDILAPAPGNTHVFQSGTSFAAPHVAGLVGLMLEVNGDLTPDVVRQLLIANVDDLGAPGRDDQYGAGRLNAQRAIEAARAWRPTLATVPTKP